MKVIPSSIFTVLLFRLAAACPQKLPEEWRDACYCYHKEENVTFETAVSRCQDDQAHLVWITSQEENMFIYEQLTSRAAVYWIGANDTECSPTEHVFRWLQSGDIVSNGFQAWAPGEPNGPGQECCIEKMMYGPVTSGTWNDNKCTELRTYVCKKEIERSTTTEPTTQPTKVLTTMIGSSTRSTRKTTKGSTQSTTTITEGPQTNTVGKTSWNTNLDLSSTTTKMENSACGALPKIVLALPLMTISLL